MAFVALLLPAMLRYLLRYATSSSIVFNVAYGQHSRNSLDIYLPSQSSPAPAPVVIFVSGGAWIIGYKAWNLFTSPQLNNAGILVVSPDYRNFPQGHASDMVEDISAAIGWVRAHISEHGGNPEDITLCGQSAGAWMAAMAMIERATDASKPCGASPYTKQPLSWECHHIKRVVGISGPYDVADKAQLAHFHDRGLYRSVLYSIFEGELSRWSPIRCVKNLGPSVTSLPPIVLMHGCSDKTVPWESSTKFAQVLADAGAKADVELFQGKSHTDGIIEDVITGHNPMLDRLVSLVLGETKITQHQCDEKASELVSCDSTRHTYPEFLILLARCVNPF